MPERRRNGVKANLGGEGDAPAEGSGKRRLPGVSAVVAVAGVALTALMLIRVGGVRRDHEFVYHLEPGARTVSQPRAYRVEVGVQYTPPEGANQVSVWLVKPQPAEDQFVTAVRYVTPPTAEGREPVHGNHLLYYEFRDPAGPVEARLGYTVVTYDMHTRIDPARVRAPARYPAEFDRYLRSEQRIVVDEEIRALAREIVGDEWTPYLAARRLFLWIIDNLAYGHDPLPDGAPGCSLQASSKFALRNRQGHCSDWHGLFVAFARSLGIPARLNYGFEPVERKRVSPSHCRAEVFLAGYGWVSLDITHARKHESEEARMGEFGYVGNDWFRATVGSDYPLVPGGRARWPGSLTGTNPPLIRIAYIEVDGEAVPEPDTAAPDARGQLEALDYRVLWDYREIPVAEALTRLTD